MLLSLVLGCMTDWKDEWSRQVVSGCIDTDTTWTSDRIWQLQDIVSVDGDGDCDSTSESFGYVELRIEPGTIVEGLPGSALLIERGATLKARGTENNPVVFQSSPEQTASGSWGGITILGAAPVNRNNPSVSGLPETDQTRFGGEDLRHYCGAIENIVIQNAGYGFLSGNNMNALTLAGCGSHTIVEGIHIRNAFQHGLEIYGGNVNIKKVSIFDVGGTGLGWDWGWKGRGQFLYIRLSEDSDGPAIEARSHLGWDPIFASNPLLFNVTLLGSGASNQIGLILKDGTEGEIQNVLASSFDSYIADVRGLDAGENADHSSLILSGALYHEGGAFPEDDGDEFDETEWSERFQTISDPLIDPDSGIPQSIELGTLEGIEPPDDFFTNERFYGALNPNEETWVLTIPTN